MKTTEQRFWAKVKKGRSGECWEWQAFRSLDGYGRIRVGIKIEQAHRVAWILTHGPIPQGMQVCHKCDNPPCVNPNHLFLGSNADNVRDRDRKGRREPLRGEKAPSAKLTRAQVKAIRARLQAGENQTAIAKDYGVSHDVIWKIKHGKKWAHVK